MKVETKKLNAALTRIAGIVKPRNVIPILSNVMIEASNGIASLTVSNLDQTAKTQIEYEGDGIDFTVPYALIADIARKAPATLIEFSDDAGIIAIKSGRAKYKLGSLPVGDFPKIAQAAEGQAINITQGQLAELTAVGWASSTEETRYYLCGVSVKTGESGGVTLRATNGHKAAFGVLTGETVELDCIIPSDAVATFGKAFKGAESLEISFSESMVTLSDGITAVTSKLIEGTFPDTSRIVPTGDCESIKLSAAQIIDAIGQLTALAESGSSLTVEIESGIMKLAMTGGGNSGTIEIDCDDTDDRHFFGINAGYLEGALKYVGDCAIELRDSGSPVVLAGVERRALIMPMRA